MQRKQSTLINGVSYTFSDITFNISGLVPVSIGGYAGIPITSINYSKSVNKSFLSENSKIANNILYSKPVFGGDITMTFDSFEMLRNQIFGFTVKDKSITNLPPVDIILTYSVVGKIAIHTLRCVNFISEDISGSEGSTFGINASFICANIDYDIPSCLSNAGSFIGIHRDNQL